MRSVKNRVEAPESATAEGNHLLRIQPSGQIREGRAIIVVQDLAALPSIIRKGTPQRMISKPILWFEPLCSGVKSDVQRCFGTDDQVYYVTLTVIVTERSGAPLSGVAVMVTV